jgi:hypothetical protein
MNSHKCGSSETSNAVRSRRALLREQTQLIGEELEWLEKPAIISRDAVGLSDETDEAGNAYLRVAAWILLQIVRAAHNVQHKLHWEETFDRYHVTPKIQERIRAAVLEPTSRYGPGILAMAEIVAVAPLLAERERVPRVEWGTIARKAENFAVRISCDGSEVQVLLRQYLSRPSVIEKPAQRMVLDEALFQLDDTFGFSTVTPIDDLVMVAANVVTKYIRPAEGACVAMYAKSPPSLLTQAAPVSTMYGAIWSAFSALAERFIFPQIAIEAIKLRPKASPDVDYALRLEDLAQRRASELRTGNPKRSWQGISMS